MSADISTYSGMVQRLRRVEIELAEKKLALSELLLENENFKRQLHQHSTSVSAFPPSTESSISWLSKTVNTIKEATHSTNRTKVN
jgi:hypothetical protein